MPVSFIPSGDEPRGQATARKRRRNQNTEIEELAALLPVKQPAVIGEGVLARGRTGGLDKISVLRLTTGFLKLQNYLHTDEKALVPASAVSGPVVSGVASSLLSEALDGFVLVLDGEGTVLFASETIANIAGLSQHDVIGQNLADITDEGDAPVISKALKSETSPPATHLDGRTEMQSRQFFIRIKSSLSPGRLQLSRFKSHIMLQVTGSLKVHMPFQSLIPAGSQVTKAAEPVILGFVGECRPIESSSSILEVSVPQSHFTSTINLDMKIISVEASVTEVVGYNPSDFIGTRMSDYFHPGDCKEMIPCEKQLLRLGHAVSPVFRFMSSSGEWVWMQLEGILRFKPDGKNPQFWEVKAKLMSQDDGKMKFIQYREMYAKSCDPNQDLLNPHKNPEVTACLMKAANDIRKEGGAEIIDSLKQAQVAASLIDPVLHGRELGLDLLPGKLTRPLTENDADDFVIERNKKFGMPIPENLLERAEYIRQRKLSMSSMQQNGLQSQGAQVNPPDSSPPVSSEPKQNVYHHGGSVIPATHSPASEPSPIGSGLDQFSPQYNQPSVQSYTSIISPPSMTFDPEKGNVVSPPMTFDSEKGNIVSPPMTFDPEKQPSGYDFSQYATQLSPNTMHNTPSPCSTNSPYNNPPSCDTVTTDQDCLSSLLSETPVLTPEAFPDSQSLEEILGDIVAINQGSKLSVECDVHSLTENRGYIDSGIGVESNEAEELIQQFLA